VDGGSKHWPGAAAYRVPTGLSGQRLWRWCVVRTIRDARLARGEGRPWPAHQLARRFERRWWRCVGAGAVAAEPGIAEDAARAGRRAVRRWAAGEATGRRTAAETTTGVLVYGDGTRG